VFTSAANLWAQIKRVQLYRLVIIIGMDL
jgi:hypothetical protein